MGLLGVFLLSEGVAPEPMEEELLFRMGRLRGVCCGLPGFLGLVVSADSLLCDLESGLFASLSPRAPMWSWGLVEGSAWLVINFPQAFLRRNEGVEPYHTFPHWAKHGIW
jgi:hypothetical protein